MSLSNALARETIKALAPAARAFERAKKDGHVWIGDQGSFLSVEDLDTWRGPKPPPNPDQLRLA